MGKNQGATSFVKLAADYKVLLREHNALITINNANVDNLNSMIVFLNMMSGVMYSLITGDAKCDDTLKELSSIVVKDKDLNMNYLRNGLITYTKTLTETQNAEKAMKAWTEYLQK